MYLTLCNPIDHSKPGSCVLHYHPEFAQIHVPRVSDATDICVSLEYDILSSEQPDLSSVTCLQYTPHFFVPFAAKLSHPHTPCPQGLSSHPAVTHSLGFLSQPFCSRCPVKITITDMAKSDLSSPPPPPLGNAGHSREPPPACPLFIGF